MIGVPTMTPKEIAEWERQCRAGTLMPRWSRDRESMAARNERIFAMKRVGMSIWDIAAEVNLSRTQVIDILKEAARG
jgi:hypothetical protein